MNHKTQVLCLIGYFDCWVIVMQNNSVEKFKDELLYTFEEVGMHFEIYKEATRKDYIIISGVLTCGYAKSYEIEFRVYSGLGLIDIHVANRDIHCSLNTGELVNKLFDLF